MDPAGGGVPAEPRPGAPAGAPGGAAAAASALVASLRAAEAAAAAAPPPPPALPAANGAAPPPPGAAQAAPAELCMSEAGHIHGPEEDHLFVQSLQRFLKNGRGVVLGGPGYRIPRLQGVEVDLGRLYRLIAGSGGFDYTTKSRKWKSMALAYYDGALVANAGYNLKNTYEKLLLPYEEHYLSDDLRGMGHEVGALARGGVSYQDNPATKVHIEAQRVAQKAAETAHKTAQYMLDQILPSSGAVLVIAPDFAKENAEALDAAFRGGEPGSLASALNALVVLSHDTRRDLRLTRHPALLDHLARLVTRAAWQFWVVEKGREAADLPMPPGPAGGVPPAGEGDWWWEDEGLGIVSRTEAAAGAQRLAVAAMQVLHNLSYVEDNQPVMAASQLCLSSFVNCAKLATDWPVRSDRYQMGEHALRALINLSAKINLRECPDATRTALLHNLFIILHANEVFDDAGEGLQGGPLVALALRVLTGLMQSAAIAGVLTDPLGQRILQRVQELLRSEQALEALRLVGRVVSFDYVKGKGKYGKDAVTVAEMVAGKPGLARAVARWLLHEEGKPDPDVVDAAVKVRPRQGAWQGPARRQPGARPTWNRRTEPRSA